MKPRLTNLGIPLSTEVNRSDGASMSYGYDGYRVGGREYAAQAGPRLVAFLKPPGEPVNELRVMVDGELLTVPIDEQEPDGERLCEVMLTTDRAKVRGVRWGPGP